MGIRIRISVKSDRIRIKIMRISNNGLRDEVPKSAGSTDRVLDYNFAKGPDLYLPLR